MEAFSSEVLGTQVPTLVSLSNKSQATWLEKIRLIALVFWDIKTSVLGCFLFKTCSTEAGILGNYPENIPPVMELGQRDFGSKVLLSSVARLFLGPKNGYPWIFQIPYSQSFFHNTLINLRFANCYCM